MITHISTDTVGELQAAVQTYYGETAGRTKDTRKRHRRSKTLAYGASTADSKAYLVKNFEDYIAEDETGKIHTPQDEARKPNLYKWGKYLASLKSVIRVSRVTHKTGSGLDVTDGSRVKIAELKPSVWFLDPETIGQNISKLVKAGCSPRLINGFMGRHECTLIRETT